MHLSKPQHRSRRVLRSACCIDPIVYRHTLTRAVCLVKPLRQALDAQRTPTHLRLKFGLIRHSCLVCVRLYFIPA